MKKILLLVSFVLIQVGSVANAHQRSHALCGHVQRVKQALAASTDVQERRPVDVLSYKLDLDLREAFKQDLPVFSGVQEIRMRVIEQTDSIVIDAGHMIIESVEINGSALLPTPQPDNSQRMALLNPSTWKSGDELTVRIRYTRNSEVNIGAYFYPKGFHVVQDDMTVEEDIFYTQSEPTAARLWMPCIDLPYDKADAAISITVQSEYTGISNGLLENVTDNFDGSRTFNWRSDKPLTTYLMVANASKYEQWEDHYIRVSDPTDSVRCLYFAWAQDLDGSGPHGLNAQASFAVTPAILREFSERFGEYPFEQYGQVPVYPYNFGGMEHQSMTTVHRFWLDQRNTSGIAHELGHQWFGDKVTCETWDDLWLNEGFATYTEAVWWESQYGYDGYFQAILGDAYYYLYVGNPNLPLHGIPVETAFGQNTPIIYYKGASVIHMLRRLVNNDTLFFNAIRDYTEAFAYKTITSSKFRDYMSDRLNIDLTQFFEQWVFGAGHPYYDITWNQDDESRDLLIQVRQQGTRTFAAPMRFIRTYSDGTIDTVAVQNAGKQQRYAFDLDLPVMNVVLDTDWSLLAYQEVSRNLSLSVDDDIRSALRFYRDGNNLVIDVSAVHQPEQVTLVDILGRTVLASEAQTMSLVRTNIRDVAPGAYFLLLQSADGLSKQKLMLGH